MKTTQRSIYYLLPKLFKRNIFGRWPTFHFFFMIPNHEIYELHPMILLSTSLFSNRYYFTKMAISDIFLISILQPFLSFIHSRWYSCIFFKIQGYKISDQTECINKLQIWRSVCSQNTRPFGVFYGKLYIYSNETHLHPSHK